MESSYPLKKEDDEGCSKQLLNLISKERDWILKMKENRFHITSEEKKLDLCLAPPGNGGGDEYRSPTKDVSRIISRGGGFSNIINTAINTTSGIKRGFTDTVNGGGGGGGNHCQTHTQKFSFADDHVFSPSWSSSSSPLYQGKTQPQQMKGSSFLQLQSTSQCQLLPPPPPLPASVMSMESSQQVDLQQQQKQEQSTEKKKAFSLPPSAAAAANTAIAAQKRIAPAAVVGWPPIRSFRKNLAKQSPESSNIKKGVVVVPTNEKPNETCFNNHHQDQHQNQNQNQKGMFVKINMDGVPIGRKVDLKAFDGYEKLSSSVDELFRDLLVAQGEGGDTCNGGEIQKQKKEEEKVINGCLLDGSGEYTLVYEDNEGDRMLVGDVPWQMFVSTVKRLRVLKSSKISTLCRKY